jgi:biotin synthase
VSLVTIEKIRVSIGSASVLGLGTLPQFKNPPTTCYIMTFKEGHCTANCGFCPQARSSKSSIEKLSRVNWPIFFFKDFLIKLKYMPSSKKFHRICIQTLNYPENFNDLIEIVTQIRIHTEIPISVAIPPMAKEKMKQLKINGVQRIGIALDGASAEVFENIKGQIVGGPYTWEDHFKKLNEALEIFYPGFVSTHIIIGLEEKEKEVIDLIEKLYNLGITVSLFAFTPIKGTKFENKQQPPISSFRKLQLARFLVFNEDKRLDDFTFNSSGEIINININKTKLKIIVNNSNAFLTSGCPGCNRPFYTSKPRGPIYNYPRDLTQNEINEIYNQLVKFVK